MRTVTKQTNNRYLNLMSVEDPKNNVKGYQFAERLGVDSIAFICYDEHTDKFLLNNEYKPPIDAFLLGAFGGSIDKDKKLIEIVQDEVEEEAGYNVDKEDVIGLGKVFVSTQMNQFCHLYLVMVVNSKKTERKPENAVEAMAKLAWVDLIELMKVEDWKAITIFSRAYSLDLLP